MLSFRFGANTQAVIDHKPCAIGAGMMQLSSHALLNYGFYRRIVNKMHYYI